MKPAPLPTLVLTAFLTALLGLSVLLAACGGNPNEHVEADQFFRPPRAEAAAQTAAGSETADPQSEQSEADPEAGPPAAESGQADQPEPEAAPAEQAEPADAAQQSAAQDDDEAGDQLPQAVRSDDLLRRYVNPSYGYSLELICPPFCDPTSNGIERAAFLAESGRALLDVIVVTDVPPDELDALWREALNVPDFVETPPREPLTLPLTGADGWRYVWEEDRRAPGGFLVRWQAAFAPLDGLLYILRGGAVADDYESVLPALQQAFDSFTAPLEAQAAPGRYVRFQFQFGYSSAYTAQEFGIPAASAPTFDAGIVVLQSEQGLNAVLVWETIGEAFFNADTAIERTLQDTLGAETSSDFRDAPPVDGRPARTALSETPLGEGIVQIASFAWYCAAGGREFSLHVIDSEDPAPVAETLLAGFRCAADDAS